MGLYNYCELDCTIVVLQATEKSTRLYIDCADTCLCYQRATVAAIRKNHNKYCYLMIAVCMKL